MKASPRRGLAAAIVSTLAVLFSPNVLAGVILGGSSIVGPTELDQLESFLGEGELTLTNIFTAGRRHSRRLACRGGRTGTYLLGTYSGQR